MWIGVIDDHGVLRYLAGGVGDREGGGAEAPVAVDRRLEHRHAGAGEDAAAVAWWDRGLLARPGRAGVP
jgi:hypothetical protein